MATASQEAAVFQAAQNNSSLARLINEEKIEPSPINSFRDVRESMGLAFG